LVATSPATSASPRSTLSCRRRYHSTRYRKRVHRIGCAYHLIDTVYDLAFKGPEIDDVIKKIANLLKGTTIGLAEAYEIDMRATRLDFYLPRQTKQNN
jgi:hypothetical protein